MANKLQVAFDDQACERLEEMRKQTGATSLAEVVRSALGVYEWALGTKRAVNSGGAL